MFAVPQGTAEPRLGITVLASYNLQNVVDSINKHYKNGFSFQPCPNGLSDNDAKLIILNEKKTQKPAALRLTK